VLSLVEKLSNRTVRRRSRWPSCPASTVSPGGPCRPLAFWISA